MRRTLKKLLPPETLTRSKMGFGVPVDHWFRGRLQPFLRETLLSEKAARRGFVKPDAVRRLVDEHASGARDHRPGLWTLLMLELWFQRFVD